MKEKLGRGQPPLWDNPDELQAKIDNYFLDMDQQKRPYTVSGLALYLRTNRQTLLNYQNKVDFFDCIKEAKQRIENYAEEKLFSGGQVAGIIFNLKNNYGWVDKTEVTSTVNGNLSLTNERLRELTTDELKQLEDIMLKRLPNTIESD